MKSQLIAFNFLLMIVMVSCTVATTNNTSVSENEAFGTPVNIQSKFSNQYPAANYISWSRYNPTANDILDWEFAGWPAVNERDYTVRFTLDTFNYHAWYSEGSEWIGSAYVVRSLKSLPDAVNNTLKAQFSSYNFDNAVRQLNPENEAFEIKLKNGDANKLKLLVDKNGNILRQKAGW